jgi:YVTN family beta-propeller protein
MGAHHMRKTREIKLFVPVSVNLAATIFIIAIVYSTLPTAFAQEPFIRSSTSKLPINTVIATVTVGSAPQGIVVTPNTDFVYVANAGSLTISEIETKTHAVVLTVPLSYSPGALAITPDGSTLYVANYYDSSVSVVDTTSNTVTTTLPLSEGPSYLAVSPDGSQVYVLCNNEESDGLIAIIDTATNQVLPTTIDIGGFPQSLVFTADGNYAYEVNDPASDVSVIDTATQSVSSTLPTTQLNAGGLALLPNGKKLYVTGDSEYVQVVNTSGKGSKKVTLPQSGGYSTPALTPNGTYLYYPINTGGSNSVYMIDTKTNQVVGSAITVGTQPWAIAIASNAKRAYVSNYADGTVSVIDIAP